MSRRSQNLFLLLVLTQGVHSIEEYLTRLFEVFAPARFISGLISEDLATGFVVFNCLLFVAGLVCYFGPVRRGGAAGRVVATLWLVLEFSNGIVHSSMAVVTGGYFSGVVTAVLLFAVASWLAYSLARDGRQGGEA